LINASVLPGKTQKRGSRIFYINAIGLLLLCQSSTSRCLTSSIMTHVHAAI